MEFWQGILGFPGYSVSTFGHIKNDYTDQHLAILANQYNVAYVGLMLNDRQHKRSVARLVARAFIPQPSEFFDTPINLNGDRLDNSVENLMWRPRRFAVRYNQQFADMAPGYTRRIQDVDTEVEYYSTWEIAIAHGLLEVDVRNAIHDREEVWPTRQRFAFIDIDSRGKRRLI